MPNPQVGGLQRNPRTPAQRGGIPGGRGTRARTGRGPGVGGGDQVVACETSRGGGDFARVRWSPVAFVLASKTSEPDWFSIYGDCHPRRLFGVTK